LSSSNASIAVSGGAKAALFNRLPSAGTVAVIATDSSAMPMYPRW